MQSLPKMDVRLLTLVSGMVRFVGVPAIFAMEQVASIRYQLSQLYLPPSLSSWPELSKGDAKRRKATECVLCSDLYFINITFQMQYLSTNFQSFSVIRSFK